MRSLDLTPLSKVTSLRGGFLEGCSTLINLKLAASYPGITGLGDNFFGGCSELKELPLAPFSNAISIGKGFLAGCVKLGALDLKPLNKVALLPQNFLSNCRSITTIDFHPLHRVGGIREGFLKNCVSLTHLDLTSFSQVSSIGDLFCEGCANLVSVDFSKMIRVRGVLGNNFLAGCTALTGCDISPMRDVQVIGDGFLKRCENALFVNLGSLASLECVGSSFLEGCNVVRLLAVPAVPQFERTKPLFEARELVTKRLGVTNDGLDINAKVVPLLYHLERLLHVRDSQQNDTANLRVKVAELTKENEGLQKKVRDLENSLENEQHGTRAKLDNLEEIMLTVREASIGSGAYLHSLSNADGSGERLIKLQRDLEEQLRELETAKPVLYSASTSTPSPAAAKESTVVTKRIVTQTVSSNQSTPIAK